MGQMVMATIAALLTQLLTQLLTYQPVHRDATDHPFEAMDCVQPWCL